MKIVKYSDKKPIISIILLDWNCRESFHIFDYFANQNISSDCFEIIWIEYYNRIPKELYDKFLDIWIVMETPENFYYHKHLMYNVGIFYSRGEIIVIMDSDVMLKPSFVSTILEEFEKDDNIVLHLDEFRNIDPKHYPFDYLSFEEFKKGCINCAGDITTGLYKRYDPIHTLNYGACFCAKKEDILKIRGADEHIDYLGHICGPYEMTFRLENYGLKVKWSHKEFLYHTWHPGTDGKGNYKGPHDCLNFSLRALDLLDNGRIYPYLENLGILKNNEELLTKNLTKDWEIK